MTEETTETTMTPREEVSAAYDKITEARDAFGALVDQHKAAGVTSEDLGAFGELAEMDKVGHRRPHPMEVTAIKPEGFMSGGVGLQLHKPGTFVAIRPCADECEGKTFLGIYMGDLVVGTMTRFAEDSGVLTIWPRHNPGIWVPELGRIVYGCESWWGPIKSPEDAEKLTITDDDIQNIWYVKALKAQFGESEGQDGEADSDEG